MNAARAPCWSANLSPPHRDPHGWQAGPTPTPGTAGSRRADQGGSGAVRVGPGPLFCCWASILSGASVSPNPQWGSCQ